MKTELQVQYTPKQVWDSAVAFMDQDKHFKGAQPSRLSYDDGLLLKVQKELPKGMVESPRGLAVFILLGLATGGFFCIAWLIYALLFRMSGNWWVLLAMEPSEATASGYGEYTNRATLITIEGSDDATRQEALLIAWAEDLKSQQNLIYA